MALLKKNLIYLSIDRGNVDLKKTAPKGVIINLSNGTWYYKDDADSSIFPKDKKFKIGLEARIAPQSYQRYGPIGVYDKTKFNHLKRMFSDKERAHRRDSNVLDD